MLRLKLNHVSKRGPRCMEYASSEYLDTSLTVDPKNYIHSSHFFSSFFYSLLVEFYHTPRVTSLTQGQSSYWYLQNNWDNHSKTKHSKAVCIFGMYYSIVGRGLWEWDKTPLQLCLVGMRQNSIAVMSVAWLASTYEFDTNVILFPVASNIEILVKICICILLSTEK